MGGILVIYGFLRLKELQVVGIVGKNCFPGLKILPVGGIVEISGFLGL